jgi:hypothetical protein
MRITDVNQWVGHLDIDQVSPLFSALLPCVDDDELVRILSEGLDPITREELTAAWEEYDKKEGQP